MVCDSSKRTDHQIVIEPTYDELQNDCVLVKMHVTVCSTTCSDSDKVYKEVMLLSVYNLSH